MKWFGKIGYWTEEIDANDPFKTINRIAEKEYYGDIIKNYKKDQSGTTINDNFKINNQISILADPYIMGNFHHMRYITFMGNKWKIASAELNYPRINLDLGDLYNEEVLEEVQVEEDDG